MYTGSICEALLGGIWEKGDFGKGGFGKRGNFGQNELGALTPNLNWELGMDI